MRAFAKAWLLIVSVILTSTLASTAYSNEGLPDEFTVKYVLTKGPLTLAEMTRKLYVNEEGDHVYESFSKPVGYARLFVDSTLLERTVWEYNGQSLRSLKYLYDRQGDKKTLLKKLIFDWKNRRVIDAVDSHPWKIKLPENTQDKLLYHLALMHDLQMGRKELEYQIADGGEIKQYTFQIKGEETIETKFGQLKTLKLIRPGRRETILWCAKEFNYIPVRIEQHEDNKQLSMHLTELAGIKRSTTAESTTAIKP